MIEFGVDPDNRDHHDPLPPAEVEERRRRSRLSLVIRDLQDVLLSVADASQFLMVVTDADGIVLWRSGSARVRRHADSLGFAEGALWTESAVGTNAIGTALAESAPVQLFSGEHFESAQHPWYCTAAPIHDPCDGSLLGVVDVSGPALTLHPAIKALVTTSVQLAEARLWRTHEDRLDRLRRSVEPLLTSSTGPLLVVDDHGWVAARHGVAGRDRIEVPQQDRAVAVPGLGVCLPERLTGGWLIRPADGTRALVAVLDLTRSPAVLDVTAGAAPWRVTLSPRHADIVQTLAAAGPAGVTAEQLSLRLYGDGDHKVTVRAEISRMRRSLGALIATNPYRLADGVELAIAR